MKEANGSVRKSAVAPADSVADVSFKREAGTCVRSAGTSQSSGLVQTTARSSPVSRTMIVFEVPSVTSLRLIGSGTSKDPCRAARGEVPRLPLSGGLGVFQRTTVRLGHLGDERAVVLAIPGLVEMELLEQSPLVEIGKNQDSPAQ